MSIINGHILASDMYLGIHFTLAEHQQTVIMLLLAGYVWHEPVSLHAAQ